jgi:hypothetical protein
MTLGDPLAATIADRRVDMGALTAFLEAGLRAPAATGALTRRRGTPVGSIHAISWELP